MTKYSRVTAKVFGETANASLADPQISQFGSGKAGAYNGTGDIATIQSLSAWSNGWIDAVTPTQQFPPLPEMTGVHKVLSYQNAYLLQQGIPEWDNATPYYINNFCAKNGKIYLSKTNENLNNDPESDTANWERFASTSGLKLGQSVWSPDPLVDSDLHIYDGSQYSTSGVYADFVTNYLIPLKTAKPNRFKSEADWQTINTQYGACGYWVLDTVNNVFRFPNITGITENTTTEADLGKITEAGLPNITGTFVDVDAPNPTGAFYSLGAVTSGNTTPSGSTDIKIGFDASISSSIYGNSTTVQPQTISGYLYCVVANGQTPTQAQTDINQIATDLAGKADVDLTNVDDVGTSKVAGWGMPSETYDTLTLGATGTTYTAPANGYFAISKIAGSDWYYVCLKALDSNNNELYSCFKSEYRTSYITAMLPVKKGMTCEVTYNATGTTNYFRFIYAKGSESEAN